MCYGLLLSSKNKYENSYMDLKYYLMSKIWLLFNIQGQIQCRRDLLLSIKKCSKKNINSAAEKQFKLYAITLLIQYSKDFCSKNIINTSFYSFLFKTDQVIGELSFSLIIEKKGNTERSSNLVKISSRPKGDLFQEFISP